MAQIVIGERDPERMSGEERAAEMRALMATVQSILNRATALTGQPFYSHYLSESDRMIHLAGNDQIRNRVRAG